MIERPFGIQMGRSPRARKRVRYQAPHRRSRLRRGHPRPPLAWHLARCGMLKRAAVSGTRTRRSRGSCAAVGRTRGRDPTGRRPAPPLRPRRRIIGQSRSAHPHADGSAVYVEALCPSLSFVGAASSFPLGVAGASGKGRSGSRVLNVRSSHRIDFQVATGQYRAAHCARPHDRRR